jgi:rubrerythrin
MGWKSKMRRAQRKLKKAQRQLKRESRRLNREAKRAERKLRKLERETRNSSKYELKCLSCGFSSTYRESSLPDSCPQCGAKFINC